jgi:hypothetical protein
MTPGSLHRTLLAAVLAGALACGCAVIVRSVQRPPRSLDADPTTTGLVAVEFSVWKGVLEYLYEFRGAEILSDAPAAKARYAPVLEIRFEPFAALFVGVPPGHYRVTRVQGLDLTRGGRNMPATTPVDWAIPDTSVTFDVVAGVATYVGDVTLDVRGGPHVVSTDTRATRERTVWRAISGRYAPSRWDSVLSRRVRAIEWPDSTPGASIDDPRPETAFPMVVMSERLTRFSRNLGPIGVGDSLIVRLDGIEYRGKHRLKIAGHDLRGVHRFRGWVGIDYDAGGEARQAWFGYGYVTDTEITDRIEFSLAAVLRLNRRSADPMIPMRRW